MGFSFNFLFYVINIPHTFAETYILCTPTFGTGELWQHPKQPTHAAELADWQAAAVARR